MSLYELNKIVGKAAKALYDNEKFPVGVLAVRARRAAEANPSDPTIVAMSNFLSKRASSDPLISRAELKDVYERLYSRATKCAALFENELGPVVQPKSAVMARDPGEGKDLMAEAYEKMADPILVNALSSAFGTTTAYKPYSEKVAVAAARTCLHELNRFVQPRKVDVVAGQADVIICQASYDTPRGTTTVLVPVEVKESKALAPSMFLTRAGFADISQKALEDHILSTAGKSFTVDAQKLLHVVAVAKGTAPKPLSEMEMIIAKAKAEAGEQTTHTVDGILYQEVDPAQLDVVVEKTAESEEFGKKLNSSAGAAEFLFGKQAVDAGRNLLIKALSGFGYKFANVAVADANDGQVFYAVSVDGANGFKVPVKIENGAVKYPTFVMASGAIYDFSQRGISDVMASSESDNEMMALASPQYSLRPDQLIQQVRTSMLDGNIARAEDAMNVLARSGDSQAFKTAFDIYKQGLSGTLKKEASASHSTCCAQRKVAHSKYMICSHINLPVHKVYQDKNGDCQPLYRRDIPEAEGGSFLNSKVYLG